MKLTSLAEIPEESVSHDPQLIKKVMIRNGEVPHLKKFAQVRFTSGQIAHAHSHPEEYEIFLVESGDGIVKVNDSKYPVSAGSCIIFEPNEVHEVVNTGDFELVLTYFGLEI